jgi:hypothetical protein
VPNPAIDTPLPVLARTLPEAEAARRARDAELHTRVFGHPTRFVPALGEWEYECRASIGGLQWYPVPGYGVFAAPAERLRTRMAERGYDIGLFREALPQCAARVGDLTRCLLRADGVEVARREGRSESQATAAAVHALTAHPDRRP